MVASSRRRELKPELVKKWAPVLMSPPHGGVS